MTVFKTRFLYHCLRCAAASVARFFNADRFIDSSSALLQQVDLLPVLLDIERPLELQVRLVVVVDELRHRFVVASADHA